jgi:hypothetical protein
MRCSNGPPEAAFVKGPSVVFIAVCLVVSLGLVSLAAVTAVIWMLLQEPQAREVTAAMFTDRPQASFDPNEAAAAAGSWG